MIPSGRRLIYTRQLALFFAYVFCKSTFNSGERHSCLFDFPFQFSTVAQTAEESETNEGSGNTCSSFGYGLFIFPFLRTEQPISFIFFYFFLGLSSLLRFFLNHSGFLITYN
jgi:hypothetical protein